MFENCIVLVIVASSAKLVMDTYYMNADEDNVVVKISSYFDYIFNVIFALETVTKSIAMGLLQEKGSYLRETWNQLDFFIVVTSIIDMSLTNIDLPVIKILWLLRTIRPLRFISHNAAMKVIIWALI